MQRNDGTVADADTFGLTIAGLHALRSRNPLAGELADLLAQHIGNLARHAEQLLPSPFAAASWDAQLLDFTAGSFGPNKPLPLTLKAEAAADVLRNESALINVVTNQQGIACRISGRSLRQFLGVQTADDYLAIAWGDGHVSSEPSWSSPLTLIQTIDYFGYVLESVPDWPKTIGHPVRPRSFNAAASLGLDAQTREEFENRISGLCTVIDQFTLPEIPAEIRKKEYGDSDGSINRLSYFLRSRIIDEPYRSSMETGLQVLRAVRGVRVAQQHDSSEKRAIASRARTALGLQPIAESWDNDWDHIRLQSAGAFTRIIDAIQSIA